MKKIFLVLLAMAMIIIVPACKKSEETGFNIVGSWTCTFNDSTSEEDEMLMTFAGNTTAGTWTGNLGENKQGGDDIIGGTYTVAVDVVSIKVTYANYENGVSGNFDGRFNSENNMSGTFAVFDDGSPAGQGTWTAIRK
jgi:hypothetical protein